MKIKSNTICFISTAGHNGFFYPIFNECGKTVITEDIENVQTRAWLSGHHHLKAIIVEASKIKDLYCVKNNQKTVVWIDIKDLCE